MGPSHHPTARLAVARDFHAASQGRTVSSVHLKEIPRLPREQREALAAFGARTSWPVGFTIYEQDAEADGVFVMLRGNVVLRSRVSTGRTVVPWVATTGETFGAEGLQPGGHYASHARADEESETLHISGSSFSALMREQPSLALMLVRQLMAERTELIEKFGQHISLTVEQRLIVTLLRMTQRGSDSKSDADAPQTVVPRRLLGELVGATRESISLVLGRLSAADLIRREGSGLVVMDAQRLALRLEHSGHGGIVLYDERSADKGTKPESPGEPGARNNDALSGKSGP
jgi:CRP/FNR family cyclic AMP-dependent transcriptional regulator